ncbi:MAG: NYN domain-containing protein [Candidatus Buchananbacteria bacterium]|jgi:uncharacterized LabA/DUF88 family protein
MSFKFKIKKNTLVLIDWANVYGWSKTLKWEIDPKKLFIYLKRPKVVDIKFYYGVEYSEPKSVAFKSEIENIGYSSNFKEVKWTPVYLEKQTHFKKIVKDLFNVLDNVKNTNSELSNKLYELIKKIDCLPKISIGNETTQFSLSSANSLKEIYDLIESLDHELKNLNIDIGKLQENLKLPVRRRKCDFDVEITTDALNLIDKFDTLLLFSGDGDYAALSKDLIAKGKKVILVFGPGHKGKEYLDISSSLFYACTVENIQQFIEK